MMRLINGLRRIERQHRRAPLCQGRYWATWGRFLRWQLGARLVGQSVAVPFVDRTRLLVRRGMTGATGNIYWGLMEFEEMALVCHALRPDDRFADVGANVGVYSVLAAGVAGARGVAFEPVADTLRSLRDNLALNGLADRVKIREAAVGASPGEIRFTTDGDTVNHVASGNDGANTTVVPLTTLNNELANGQFTGGAPTLIKIDVEGYEPAVIEGAATVLADPGLQVVITESIGAELRYGDTGDAVDSRLRDAGFTPVQYDPRTRQVTPLKTMRHGNTPYARDPAWLRDRVRTAAAIRVLGQSL